MSQIKKAPHKDREFGKLFHARCLFCLDLPNCLSWNYGTEKKAQGGFGL